MFCAQKNNKCMFHHYSMFSFFFFLLNFFSIKIM